MAALAKKSYKHENDHTSVSLTDIDTKSGAVVAEPDSQLGQVTFLSIK